MRFLGLGCDADEEKFFFSAIANFSAGSSEARSPGQMMSVRVAWLEA
jgi:hypothetical protein